MGDDQPRSLLILYATETGNAEDVAWRIARQCRRIHFRCRVLSTDVYPIEDLISEPLVLFVVATTGSGKEPRSMATLWATLIRADLPSHLFEDMHCAVFGLGDTAYEKFCWPAKLLERRFESLGATLLCPRGEGDDQHQLGVDGALLPWMRKVTDALQTLFPLPESVTIDDDAAPPAPRVSIRPAPVGTEVQSQIDLDGDCFFQSTVLRNDRITTEGWEQDVRHIELELADVFDYNPGDVAVVYPQALPHAVDTFLTTMGWSDIADDPIILEPALHDEHIPRTIPSVTSLRSLFTHHLDFSNVPRRSFFELIRHFATDEMERAKLFEFCQEEGEGAEDLYEYCTRVRRTTLEVLEDFRSVRLPREHIFDAFPPLRPRYFSIASSAKCHPKQVHLCVAIVKYRTKLKIPRRGICTTYLASLVPGDIVTVGIEKGLLEQPPSHSTPIICVGPGTGVAPMRALIEERILHSAKDNTLYFGCRSASQDQHYAAEWAQNAEKDNLVYRLAASRDGPEGVARTYVQHLIQQDAKRIWELVGTKGAWVYISGSANKMPVAVKEAIRFAVEKEGGKTPEEASRFVREMERVGRLLEECWS